jgi:hypothetical protein
MADSDCPHEDGVAHIVPLSKQAPVILYDLKKVAAENARFMFPVLGLQLRGTPARETADDG